MASRGELLRHFGIGAEAELGRGGEAVVYALDEARVLRVPHVAATPGFERRRREFLLELRRAATRSAIPFLVPEWLESLEVCGEKVSIERRMPGRSLMEVLGEIEGSTREALIRRHLDAAAQIGNLTLERPYFGDVLRADAIRARSQREYLELRARASLSHAGSACAGIDAAGLARALPEPERASLVHLDAFAANMMTDGRRITAVIDFGTVSILGDRRLDPLFCVAYLHPAITPVATRADRRVAERWLAERGLLGLYPAARRWIAAFWSACTDDPPLYGWCRQVLLS